MSELDSNIRVHEYALIFPAMPEQQFSDLIDDIRNNGLIEAIWLYEDQILDGRHRYLACMECGIEPSFRNYEGNDPVGFVLSLNARRRHCTQQQLIDVIPRMREALQKEAKKRQLRKPADFVTANLPEQIDAGEWREKAAKDFGISPRTVQHISNVADLGSEELKEAVRTGVASISTAADIATLPKEKQTEIVAVGEKEIIAASKEIRARRASARRVERVQNISAISSNNRSLGSDNQYAVVYADPPWRYEYIETESRAIENNYPTMSLDDICAMPLDSITLPDCVLFLWVTSPKLEEGMRVLREWGFTYRTCAVWDKQKIGMGYYFRQQHELLLVGTKGNVPTPEPKDRPASVFCFSRGKHSAKPDEVRNLIAKMYDSLPKIELFCRDPAEGWDVWGNQSGS